MVFSKRFFLKMKLWYDCNHFYFTFFGYQIECHIFKKILLLFHINVLIYLLLCGNSVPAFTSNSPINYGCFEFNLTDTPSLIKCLIRGMYIHWKFPMEFPASRMSLVDRDYPSLSIVNVTTGIPIYLS